MFRRLLLLMLAVMLLVPSFSAAQTVVTSFYPIWLLTLNLTDGIPDIEVRNLAAPDTGCLHDYQLQTSDMKNLSAADVFLVNGAGMESFLDLVYGVFPELPVVSASDGITLLTDSGALQIGESEEEGLPNAHIWLDVSNAIRMARNLSAGLISAIPEREAEISSNLGALIQRLEALDKTLHEGLSNLQDNRIVTFHEAFPYFASAYGLDVVAVVNREPGEALTPAQMARLVETVQQLGNVSLFVEPQYEELSARTLSAETGAPVYMLDPVVTGPESDIPLDYYETVMLRNMAVLQEALGVKESTPESH